MSGNYISLGGVFLIFLSILGGLSASDFFQFWVFLELNLMGFIVYACLRKESGGSGGLMEYFLVQSFYSCLSILMYMHFPDFFFWSSYLVGWVLLLKLGVAPFHGWLINLFSVLDWETLWFVSVVQKVLPIFGVSVLWGSSDSTYLGSVGLVVILSVVVSVSLSISELVIGKLLGLSSLFNQAWLVGVVKDVNIMFSFLLIYGVSLGVFIVWLSYSGYKVSGHLGKAENQVSSGAGFLGLASLAGMPPFGFFFAKLQVVRFLLGYAPGLSLFLLMSSVFMLMIYGRLFMPLVLSLDKLGDRTGGWASGAMCSMLVLSGYFYF